MFNLELQRALDVARPGLQIAAEVSSKVEQKDGQRGDRTQDLRVPDGLLARRSNQLS